MINVLINAYAVSPSWGSEAGVGWNLITNIAKHCNVYVITEGQWREEIEVALTQLPQKDNIHFHYNPVPQSVRDMCWNQGDWRFYHYYRLWQQKTLDIAKDIIASHQIDVIHQLNMIGFREPGYLWQIKNIPFVWGPIGNMAPLPLQFLNDSPIKVRIKQRLKNIISNWQVKHGRVRKALRSANQIVTALDTSADIIKKVYGVDNIIVMPETGLVSTKGSVSHKVSENRPIRLLWVGRFISTKRLDYALQILSELEDRQAFELHIVGWGDNGEEAIYRQMAEDLSVADICKWYGKISHNQVQQMMKGSDVMLFTSVLEGTPHVVLEAIANNLPIMCFNICGHGQIVSDEIGWKFDATCITSSKQAMISTLNRLNNTRSEIELKSKNCDTIKSQLSWESKAQKIVEVYQSVLS